VLRHQLSILWKWTHDGTTDVLKREHRNEEKEKEHKVTWKTYISLHLKIRDSDAKRAKRVNKHTSFIHSENNWIMAFKIFICNPANYLVIKFHCLALNFAVLTWVVYVSLLSTASLGIFKKLTSFLKSASILNTGEFEFWLVYWVLLSSCLQSPLHTEELFTIFDLLFVNMYNPFGFITQYAETYTLCLVFCTAWLDWC
jgi:hypothetical protein